MSAEQYTMTDREREFVGDHLAGILGAVIGTIIGATVGSRIGIASAGRGMSGAMPLAVICGYIGYRIGEAISRSTEA